MIALEILSIMARDLAKRHVSSRKQHLASHRIHVDQSENMHNCKILCIRQIIDFFDIQVARFARIWLFLLCNMARLAAIFILKNMQLWQF